jgi:GNAT superfamily N-acetyltransferase
MQISVRPLLLADDPQISDLASAAVLSARDRRGGGEYLELFRHLQEPHVEELTEFLAMSQREVLVGLLDGHLFAACLLRHHQTVLTVEALYVDPEAREVGLGTALMQAAQQRAEDLACERLEALALPGDRRMKQRAESQAMKARLLVLSKALRERS